MVDKETSSAEERVSDVAQTGDPDWWTTFHVPEMADLFLERDADDEQTKATVEFLIDVLQLSADSRVYDQCCGTGSLSLLLAERGICVVGADLCADYVERARDRQAQAAGAIADRLEFHCADAMQFVPPQACDGAFNWYSSFGYAASDARNAAMLQRAWDGLRPGGTLAMDLPNFAGILRNFQKYLVRHGEIDQREVTLIRESQIDLTRGQLRQNWVWIVAGEPTRHRQSRLKIYWPHQIREMLEAIGFQQIDLYGSLDREKLDVDSSRLLIVARKPYPAATPTLPQAGVAAG